MNTLDLLENGHVTVVDAVEGLTEVDWGTPGACGHWSIKDIMAHLASYEQVLVDLLNKLLDPAIATPTLDQYSEDYYIQFNSTEVASRQHKTASEIMAEYETAQANTLHLLSQIPRHDRQEKGIHPWPGSPYDLEDFIIYSIYGHKQTHCAQITAFRKQLDRQSNGRNDLANSLVHQLDLPQSIQFETMPSYN